MLSKGKETDVNEPCHAVTTPNRDAGSTKETRVERMGRLTAEAAARAGKCPHWKSQAASSHPLWLVQALAKLGKWAVNLKGICVLLRCLERRLL